MSKHYTAHIEIFSRGAIRGGVTWSTKQVKEAMLKLGYKCFITGSHQLIQTVEITGTRDDIIRQRTEISDRLRSMSTGRMATRFDLIND